MFRIEGAALINRFYKSEGWTKELVAGLLNKPDVNCITERTGSFITDDDSTYYAYYETYNYENPDVSRFVRSKVEQYEFIPFKIAGHGSKFEDNNFLIEE